MRYTLITFLLVLILACQKEKTDSTPVPVPVPVNQKIPSIDQLPPARPNQSAYIGGGGTSLAVGFPLSKNVSYQKYAGDSLGKVWFAEGIPSATTDKILATYSTVINYHANYVIVEGGINDMYTEMPASLTADNLEKMIDMVVGDSSIPIYFPIWPCNGVNNVGMERADQVSATVIAWIQKKYPQYVKYIIDFRPLLGEFRPNAGAPKNIWKLKDIYSYDGTHLNERGYRMVGDTTAEIILKNL